MLDLAFLGLTALLAAMSWGFIVVCEKLMEGPG
jgi:hypothetical protein